MTIAETLAGAQYASDCGKFHKLSECERKNTEILAELLPESLRKRAENLGYRLKDCLIMQAIMQISMQKCGSFRFWVEKDAEGIADYLVYFDVKCEKRMQISFHSFNGKLRKFCEKSRNSRGHWDEKSSRAACIEMMRENAEA